MSDQEEDPILSSEDLNVVAKSLRHERANRIWVAKKKKHPIRTGALMQLKRLETIFLTLSLTRAKAERKEKKERESC